MGEIEVVAVRMVLSAVGVHALLALIGSALPCASGGMHPERRTLANWTLSQIRPRGGSNTWQ